MVDFEIREGLPTAYLFKIINFFHLEPDKYIANYVKLRYNLIETYDTFLNLFSEPTIEHTFFDVGEVIPAKFPRSSKSDTVF